MNYEEIEGDLVELANSGKFDVIAHGCNCWNKMRKGLAPQMAAAFHCDMFTLEDEMYRGNINKLGQIDYGFVNRRDSEKMLTVVNCYTQFKIRKFSEVDYEFTTPDAPLDYAALALCLKKINHVFKGKHIGLPQIGCHLAGGDWALVRMQIQAYLVDCDVTIVIKPS